LTFDAILQIWKYAAEIVETLNLVLAKMATKVDVEATSVLAR
jgi:hypothetical protein